MFKPSFIKHVEKQTLCSDIIIIETQSFHTLLSTMECFLLCSEGMFPGLSRYIQVSPAIKCWLTFTYQSFVVFNPQYIADFRLTHMTSILKN